MKNINRIIGILILAVICFNTANAQGYKLPPYSKFKLDNGMTVYLMEQHDVPLIAVSAVVAAGAIDDTKSGIAEITALSLMHGTKSFTKTQIDEKLDFMGASVNIQASKEFATLSSKFAAKDETTAMNIIKELLTAPTFDKGEFDKEKMRVLAAIERDKESPKSVINNYFDKLLYGNHVYGNVVTGTKTSMETITNDDVKNFYKANYTPNNSAISIVGDFNSAKMKKAVTAMFSDWKKGTAKTADLAAKAIVNPTAGQVLLVNKDDANETTFVIGSAGVARNNKDQVAIQVVNTLFGGRFTSMLNEELRTNSGLTYGARSSFASYKNGGGFTISTFTAKETTEKAIDLAMTVIGRLHSKGLDEKSLASAKNYVKGQFPPRYETVEQLSNLLMNMYWYDFDESYINDFEKNVDGLTLEKTKEIIKNYFPKDKFQMVLIGKASEIKKIAEKYGPVNVVEIKN